MLRKPSEHCAFHIQISHSYLLAAAINLSSSFTGRSMHTDVFVVLRADPVYIRCPTLRATVWQKSISSTSRQNEGAIRRTLWKEV
jgi:hypothetical protein